MQNTEGDTECAPDDPLIHKHIVAPPYQASLSQSRKTTLRHFVPYVVHGLLLSTSIGFFIAGLSTVHVTRCSDQLSHCEYCIPSYDQLCANGNVQALIAGYALSQAVRFDGGFDRSSPFKGPPSKETDEAWERILPLTVMRIPERTFQTLNASKFSVKVPEDAGGGRMALFEAFHQLHCLRTLWMSTYPEYYKPSSQFAQEHPDDWRNHIDHCADMLRQKLMCDADDHLVTYNWIRNHRFPHPNFNVLHQCRDYEKILETAQEYAVDRSLLSADGYILRPTHGSVVEFDIPPFDPSAES
ncbi:hypothetical protein BDV95DRAFT_490986 [Massariosphaeria phaeospora]|uniref:Uncharacterized protein n=1 Tax=Massariosphaeria phaeospora TaxID=100035 RepID=A0A7C8I9R6_9PLEO|nr:hypothetical protein BDV95DRAFT_490986 [Massariosphaeria phaeospora]